MMGLNSQFYLFEGLGVNSQHRDGLEHDQDASGDGSLEPSATARTPRTHCSHRAHAHRRDQLAWGVQLPDSSLRRPAIPLGARCRKTARGAEKQRAAQ